MSTDPEDHPPRNFERDIAAKAKTDSIYAARSRGVMEFSKVKYRSRAGDVDVPAYLFAPLAKRGARGHAAMVWVHGGVHGDWNEAMLPFVKEAVHAPVESAWLRAARDRAHARLAEGGRKALHAAPNCAGPPSTPSGR